MSFDRIPAMILCLRYFLGCMVSAFGSRQDLVLENLALRQQLLALHAKRPRRRLSAVQKLFWVMLLKRPLPRNRHRQEECIQASVIEALAYVTAGCQN